MLEQPGALEHPRDTERERVLGSRARTAGFGSRFAGYVRERFPVGSYGPLILALVICGRVGASVAVRQEPVLDASAVLTVLAVAAAFLQLRILDDLHDAGADLIGRPERPLPRGLVSEHELRLVALAAAAAGAVMVIPLGVPALLWYGAALVVIWALKFDVPWRPAVHLGLVGTALVHSTIAPAIGLFVWSTAAPVAAGSSIVAILMVVWGASLAIEFARKTLSPADERPNVLTYSAALGVERAVTLGALATSVAFVGTGAFAASVGAPSIVATMPFVAAAAWPLLARRATALDRVAAIRAATVAAVMATLLWPLVLVITT